MEIRHTDYSNSDDGMNNIMGKKQTNDKEGHEIDKTALEHYQFCMPHAEVARHLYEKHGVDEGRAIFSPEETKKRIKEYENRGPDFNLAKGKGATVLDRLFSYMISTGEVWKEEEESRGVESQFKGLSGFLLGQAAIKTTRDSFKRNEGVEIGTTEEVDKLTNSFEETGLPFVIGGLFGYRWFMFPEEEKTNVYLTIESHSVLSAGNTKGFDLAAHIGNGTLIELEQNLDARVPKPFCITAAKEHGEIIITVFCSSMSGYLFVRWPLNSNGTDELAYYSVDDEPEEERPREREALELRLLCERLLTSTLALKHCSPELFYGTFDKPQSYYIEKSVRAKSTKKKKQALRMANKVSMFAMRSPDAKKIFGPKVTGTGTKISTRFTVAGHFRLQLCGQGLSKKKMIWIEAYEKGTELGENNNPSCIKQPMNKILLGK